MGFILLAFLGGLVVGSLLVFALRRGKEVRLEADLRLERERLQLLEESKTQIHNTFQTLSSEVLQKNSESFLQLAQLQFEKFHEGAREDLKSRQEGVQNVIKPVAETLAKMDLKMNEWQVSRARGDEALVQQVRGLMEAQKDLRTETSRLVTALRAPQGRGQWGEIQLKRVVEMAGMIQHCDFSTQTSTNTEEGRLRPDMIVRLPGDKRIVVDAKTPLLAYLEAQEQPSIDLKREKLKDHARQVRKHMEQLGKKSYWDQFQPAPEFVVLFLPGESFFSAALEADPSLIELGVAQNVILATPTTLIALLRAVAFGWRQEKLAENARVIGDLGKELYKRLGDLGAHFTRLGKALNISVDAYNNAVGTLETRVLVSARKFQELDSSGTNAALEALPQLDQRTRTIQAPEVNRLPSET